MKRLLSSTAALSIALANVQPWPLMAQTVDDSGQVIAADGSVLCAPTADAVCNPADFADAAKAIEDAMKAQAAADQAAADQAAADQAAADQAAADQVAADKAAADQAAADKAAADQAAADKAAADQAAVDQAAADQAAADQAAADKAAADQAVTDQAAADQAAADKAAADQAVTDQAAADKAAADQAVTDQAAADQAAADKAAADQAVTDQAAADQAAVDKAAANPAAAAEPTAAAAGEAVVTDAIKDPSTGLMAAAPSEEAVAPVVAPVPTEAEVETLSTILGTDEAAAFAAPAAAALVDDPATAGAWGKGNKPADAPASSGVVAATTEVLTDMTARTSTKEFTRAPVSVGDGKKSGLSDLEKVGLVALGALVVGAIINEGKKDQRKVVSNTGDRVVVQNPDGSYQVYKDDDAVIRRPGSTVRTETFKDGSTRSIVERKDGTQIVTIRDASGRVLRRAQYDNLGRELVLIDDLQPEEVVVIRDLPKPKKKRVVISTQDGDAAFKAALAAADAERIGRKFSLRQIREISEVRQLAATIDVDNITFDSGSSAITAAQAQNLADLGRLMQNIIDDNPAELFLIEGHTDAVGSAASNLALSDRRAESVALALTEYFDIPPENMVVQGYGESELRIDTQSDERANRRAAVRIISPLMRVASK